LEEVGRYYSGVTRGRTTICWVLVASVAMVLATATGASAQPAPAPAGTAPRKPAKADAEPLALFPTRPLWTLALKNVLTAPPAVDGASAYFPIEGDRIAAYDLESGDLRWVISSHAQSEPAVGPLAIYVVEPETLAAYDRAAGAELWRVPFAEPLGSPLVFENGWLVATTRAGRVVALRAADGASIWQREVGAAVRSPAALEADRVYIATEDDHIVALEVTTGEETWRRRLGGPGDRILAVDDRVFVGSRDNHLYCLRARDGAVVWRWATGADVIGLPLVTDDHVYFVSLDNVLRALDRRSGNQRWKRALPQRATRGPVQVGDTLLVSGNAPRVMAFAMKDGQPGGDLTGESGLAAPPHVRLIGGLPVVTLIEASLTEGTVVRAFTRSLEPRLQPIAPLPNAITPPTPDGSPESSSDSPRPPAPNGDDRGSGTRPSPSVPNTGTGVR
jgi:outer membrane protein assembly factor BamB